jgi:DNA-binding HxlR family transcriptional regulator
VLLIVRDLLASPRRFNELEESFPGVSTRTLTEKLKVLEDEGIVVKHKYAEFPPRVEYELTEKGGGLSRIVKEMEAYGKKFL